VNPGRSTAWFINPISNVKIIFHSYYFGRAEGAFHSSSTIAFVVNYEATTKIQSVRAQPATNVGEVLYGSLASTGR
jgi:hypothetical protein